MRGALIRIVALIWILILSGCAVTAPTTPPGEIPTQGILDAADEAYGHQVLNDLTREYPLDTDDSRINRVQAVVDKVTQAAGVAHNPWHVFVLVDRNFQNAGATRGNYIFVWTGLLDVIQSDAELAIVLSHEVAHVLANHVAEDPTMEAQTMMGGVIGSVAGQIILSQGGLPVLADLAHVMIQESLNAILINPDLQTKELEADQIGLFLVAKAGYNPQEAINFWERMKDAPGFSGFPVQFLSSHPSSEDRIEYMKKLLPQANEVYLAATGMGAPTPSSPASASPWAWNSRPNGTSSPATPASQGKASSFAWDAKSPPPAQQNSSFAYPKPSSSAQKEVWIVEAPRTTVYSSPSPRAAPMGELVKGTTIVVREELMQKAPRGVWLEVENPARGYVMSADCAPSR